MQEEIWKDIAGYEGLYKVSSFGNIVSVKNDKRKAISQEVHQRGYLRVNLCKGKVRKHYRVHRLVATAFIDNPLNLPQVDHIDGDKTNNHVNNLRWVDNATNSRSRHIIGRKRRIGVVGCDGNIVKEYDSERDAARCLGVNRTTIMAACRGIQKVCAGYVLKYIP